MARRFPSFLTAAAVLAFASTGMMSATALAGAEGQQKRHALSLIGEPRFPADYTHFDFVNPDAPRGGAMRMSVVGTFDNMNPFTIKGIAAAGLGEVFDTLMANSPDEPSTEYCLVCEWVSHPDDFSSVTFKLRDGARFHDGKPVTVDDVIFSMEAIKAADDRRRFYYKNVMKGEKTGEGEVTFKFDVKGNRELPLIVGQLHVLPKHYWEGKDAEGNTRDITKTTMEPPIGSGAYKVKTFDAGRMITLERVKDYWAENLPVAKGQSNFDELVYLYFRDDTAPFEEFKLGKVDLWQETTAANWATRYGFEAVKQGKVKKEALPHKNVAGMQAFAFNTRKKQFQDPRVRQAFNYAFDFEAANKNRFYGSYIRTKSFFDNSELASSGLPEGRELELLKSLDAEIPKEVFTTPYKPPGESDQRKSMNAAHQLLKAAGWTTRTEQKSSPDCGWWCRLLMTVGLRSAEVEAVLRNAAGETLDAEFLLVQPNFEAIVLPIIADLKKLGVNASVRTVDVSQYKRRVDQFDFDIIVDSWGQSHSPGNEQRDFWSSEAADRPGSNNTVGIKSPAVDKLIDTIIMAKDRAELVAATRALDRVLLWNHYVIPNWYYPFVRVAYWDKFGRPEKLPSQVPLFTQSWWLDAAKEKASSAVTSQ